MIKNDAIKRERVLLVFASAFVLLIKIQLSLVREAGILSFWPVLVFILVCFSLHLALNRILPARDPGILPVILLMAGWGIVLIDRLAPSLLLKQTVWLIVASVGLVLTSLLPANFRILEKYRYLWLISGIVLLLATLFLGVNPGGYSNSPRLWLDFGLFYFQPSELLKILMIVFLASYLAEKSDLIKAHGHKVFGVELPSFPYIAPMLFMWGFCIVLLVWQRDLGAAFHFFLIFLLMLYLATDQLSYLGIGLILLLLVGIAGYFLYDVVKLRIDIFLDPWSDPSGRSYQIVQSLIAVASGGIVGKGIGLGAPLFVPVVHSDFIFTAIAEEWGLSGTLGILLLMSLLFYSGVRVALRQVNKPFHLLLAAGVVISLTVQSIMIVGGILKILPLTGITLPFISYGGSSLVVSFMMVALLLRISDPESECRIVQRLFRADGD